MLTDQIEGTIIRASDFVFSPFDWGRVAEPVGPAMGASKVVLLVVEVAPDKVWRLGWSTEEENVAVAFRGHGHGDVTGHRSTLEPGSAPRRAPLWTRPTTTRPTDRAGRASS